MQPARQRGKYNKAVISLMAVLLLFLILTDILIARHQRDFLLAEAENQIRRDLQLISLSLRDPLLANDHLRISRFLSQWGDEHPEVVRLAAVLPSGGELLSLQRPVASGETFRVERKVSFQDKELLTLKLTASSLAVEELLRKLRWQLGLASCLLTAIAGIAAWYTLKRLAIIPLEREIGLRLATEEQLAAAQDELEARVLARTADLEEANRLLRNEVSERNAAEEELARLHRQYELILNSAGEGIYGVDDAGRVTFVNLAAQHMLGFREDELIGNGLHDFRHHVRRDGAGYSGEECPVCRAYTSGKMKRAGEGYFGRKDGTVFPVEFLCSPIEERGRVVGTVVVFEDITLRKQAEHDLLELTDTLEQRVAERTARMNAANQELRETLGQLEQTQAQLVHSEKMAALGDLVAGVAHEINTPVGVGVTAASYLAKETRAIAALHAEGRMKRSDLAGYLEVSQESAKLILSNLNRAAALIRSFKQVAIDQSGEGRRTFLLAEYLEEVCLSLRPILKNTPHRLEINCPADLALNSYPGAISQIVTNFITNSITHAYREGEAGCLRFDVALSGGNVHFRYSDDGKGMHEEEVRHVFDPFFTTNREKGGSGLGLHIVYNIVTQKLWGAIKCESRPGGGASFVLVFPAVIPG
ncbi:PAS domain-containing sensor histidine kinase [Thiovibrio sp. JS02]